MIKLIKCFFIDIMSILRSMWMIGIQIFSKRETQLYPDISCDLSARYRGRIILTKDALSGYERCVACNLCAVSCPVGCISLKKSETADGRWYPEFFRINFSRCIFCGMCEESCPTAAIQLIPDIEMSDFKRKDLVYEKSDLLISGPGKNLEYNFYKVSGINSLDKQKGESEHEVKPISVKNLLP